MNVVVGREFGELLRCVFLEWWVDMLNCEFNFDICCDNKWSNWWGLDEKDREFCGKWGGDGVDKEGVKDGIDGGGYY